MTIKLKKISEKEVVLFLEGRLDSGTSPAAQEAFMKTADQYAKITLNMKGLEYISSAGLRVILTLQKQVNRNGGHLSITNVSEAVAEVFEITGFSGILDIG